MGQPNLSRIRTMTSLTAESLEHLDEAASALGLVRVVNKKEEADRSAAIRELAAAFAGDARVRRAVATWRARQRG
jgi:hypothetical protein